MEYCYVKTNIKINIFVIIHNLFMQYNINETRQFKGFMKKKKVIISRLHYYFR